MTIQEDESVLISEKQKKYLFKRIEIPGEKKKARWIKSGRGEGGNEDKAAWRRTVPSAL